MDIDFHGFFPDGDLPGDRAGSHVTPGRVGRVIPDESVVVTGDLSRVRDWGILYTKGVSVFASTGRDSERDGKTSIVGDYPYGGAGALAFREGVT